MPARRSAATIACVVSMSAGCASPPADDGDALLMLAAASTIDAVEAAVSDFEGRSGIPVDVSFGPTSTLARQVEQGAPADLMLSASREWGDYVRQHSRVERSTVLVGNRLVVVRPRTGDGAAADVADFLADPVRRLAIADPASVPAGVYARQAIESMGAWEKVADRLVPTVDVRAALALVAAGEVDGGIVYATDAGGDDEVILVGRIDPALHDPIEYPLLLLDGAGPGAERLYEFLISEAGRRHFLDRGFVAPDR